MLNQKNLIQTENISMSKNSNSSQRLRELWAPEFMQFARAFWNLWDGGLRLVISGKFSEKMQSISIIVMFCTIIGLLFHRGKHLLGFWNTWKVVIHFEKAINVLNWIAHGATKCHINMNFNQNFQSIHYPKHFALYPSFSIPKCKKCWIMEINLAVQRRESFKMLLYHVHYISTYETQ